MNESKKVFMGSGVEYGLRRGKEFQQSCWEGSTWKEHLGPKQEERKL